MLVSGKAQAAMEFLITYGWAILAVLITLGALSYFGVLSPSNLLPEKCSFPSSIGCPDFEVGDSGIKIILQNNFGKAVKITSLSFTSDALNMLSGSCSTGTISAALKNGEKATFYANDPLNCVFKNTGRKKNKYGVLVNYQLLDTALPRLLDGELRAEKGDASISGGGGEYGGGSGDSALRAYWSFDEGSGTTTSDLSGNGNNGALTGFGCTTLNCDPNSGWTSVGRIGNALVFDGGDDALDGGSGSSLAITGPITVSAWIRPESTGEGGFGRVMDKGDIIRFYMNSGTATNFDFAFMIRAGSVQRFAYTSGQPLARNAWSHVAGVWNGANVLVYVNGVEFVGEPATGSIDNHAAQIAYFGNRGGRDRTFDGAIDDIKIWNRALSASEIAALAAS